LAVHDQLYVALQAFAATIAGDYDVSDVLHRVCDHLVEVVGGAGAGVSLLDGGGQVRFAAATSTAVGGIERYQEDAQDGPCAVALRTGKPVVIGDVCGDRRWPAYCDAVQANGMRAVLAVPLVVREDRIGAVDVYDVEARRWSDHDVAAATVLAQMATAYVIRANATAEVERVNEQLQQALESRIVIEQAKGRLAGERGIDVDDAFEVIRGHARSHNETVRSVAERIVAGELDPPGSERGAGAEAPA